MPWFKVDDKLHDHRKARVAKKAAMGVWVLAGSWSMDNLTDGFIPADVLTRWGTKADANALVKAGFWSPCERDGEPGWQFHDWDEFQPTRASVEDRRRQRAQAGRKGGKASGASKREANASASASAVASTSAFDMVKAKPNPRSRPVPVPLSVVTTSSQSPTALDALTDEDWQKIEQATRGNRSHAHKVATDVLSKSAGDVTNPRRYILRAVKNEPELYRYRRGNPTKADECHEHVGEWGDNCRICAAEKKWGSA